MRMLRRGLAASSIVGLSTSLLLIGPASAAPLAPPDACPLVALSDFDGDCRADIVVGAPLWDAPSAVDAGAVQLTTEAVFAGESSLITASLLGFADEPGAQFGAAVLVTDLDTHAPVDLVIGAPGAEGGAGAIYLVYGNPSGLGSAPSVRITEASLGLDASGARDFGRSLAVVSSLLAVGAPLSAVDGVEAAGHVVLISEPTLSVYQVISMGHGAPGTPGAGDRFGWSLAGIPEKFSPELAVGIPYRDVGGHVDAGAVALVAQNPGLAGWDPVLLSQDSPGVPGAAENGDRFGYAIAAFSLEFAGSAIAPGGPTAILAGAPGEDLGSIIDAGALTLLLQTDKREGSQSSPLPTWAAYPKVLSQNSPGFAGSDERGDQLGRVVAADGLLGVPYEDVGSIKNAGQACWIVLRDPPNPIHALCLNQDTTGVAGAAEPGDRMGSSVGMVLDSGLGGSDPGGEGVFGAAGEDIGTTADAGLVYVGEPFFAQVCCPINMRSVSAADVQAGAGLGSSVASSSGFAGY